MRRRTATVLAAVALALFAGVGVRSQEEMREVSPDPFPRPQRPPAVFPHDAHNEKAGIEACNECHHVYENGKRLEDESSEDRRCADCHGLADEGRRPGLRKAFHRNCQGCHLERRAGPIVCGECHRRG
ncbi:MAG: cytochrome c3 family protein [Desulfobacterales bacterium]